MIIFLDDDNVCFLNKGAGMRAVETNAFDGKCREYIEGYRYIPAGENWVRDDGKVFCGEAMMPVKPYAELMEAQAAFVTADRDKCLADMQELIDEMLGG